MRINGKTPPPPAIPKLSPIHRGRLWLFWWNGSQELAIWTKVIHFWAVEVFSFGNTHIDQWAGNVTENGRCSKPQSRPALINTSLRRSSSSIISSCSANVHPAGLWLVGGLARLWIQLGFKTKQTFFTTLRIVFIYSWFVGFGKPVEVGLLEQN